MKKLTLALVATAIITSPAAFANIVSDADCPVETETPKKHHHKHGNKKHHKHRKHRGEMPMDEGCNPCVQKVNFAGPYVGATIGLAIGTGRQSNQAVDSNGGIIQNNSARMAIPGVVGGLNAGWGLVCKEKLYVAADVFGDLSSAKSNLRSSTPPSNFYIKSQVKMKGSVAAGGKFGVIHKNVLLYTTAHWIASQWTVTGKWNDLASAQHARKKKFRSGFRVGVGMAYPVTNKILIGMQTGYAWYPRVTAKKTVNATSPATGTTTGTFKHKPEMFDARATVAYLFKGTS